MIEKRGRLWIVETGRMSVQVEVGEQRRAFITCESEAFDDELTPELAHDIIHLLSGWLTEHEKES